MIPVDAKPPAGVELATSGDEADLLDILRMKHAEDVGSAPFPLSSNQSFIRRGIRGNGGCIGVIRGKKRIEASIGVFIGNWCWPVTPDEHLYDRWLFVHPSHRRTEHGRNLIEFARWMSEHCGRPYIAGHIINDRTAAKSLMYERAMGTAFAFIYVHDPSGIVKPRDLSARNEPGRGGLRISRNDAKRLTTAGVATGLLARRGTAA